MTQPGACVLTREGLGSMVDAFRADGRTVIGPAVRDGVIVHDEISSIEDLPAGWTEEAEAGSYRLEPTGTDELFAFSSPSQSWKRFLYPERTLLIRASRGASGMAITQPEPDVPSLVFLGIRPCDLAALDVLDRVFDDPAATDPTYTARRADLVTVAVACGHPGNTCFCASMDTGPSPRGGYDLALTELGWDGPTEYLVDVNTERGAEVMERIEHRQATAADRAAAEEVHRNATARMGRHLDGSHPPQAAKAPDHPRWDDVADRCLACGNCTMVCPTCFCSTTVDSTDLPGGEAELWRVWDSCFTQDFSYLHGGSVRSSIKARYRQWLLHKLVTWHDQFDTSGCVGCGRCITWCPVGIDLTEEIRAIAESPPTARREEPT
ncbi:MAG: 4Fe-4S dicluster domain-containing protein [Microthrixaceae bacterium]